MSSILKALKKVETDAAQTVGAGPSQINARGAVSGRARRGLILRRIFLVLIIVACLLAGWWAFARYRPILAKWISKPEPQLQATQKAAAPQRGVTTREARIAALREQSGRRRAVSPPVDKVTVQPPAQQEAQVPRPPSTQGQLPPQTVVSQQSEKGPEVPPLSEDPPTPPPRRLAPSVRPETQGLKGTTAGRSYPRVTRPGVQSRETTSAAEESESELEVQAIAWAEDPAKRIAVVNGRVVREGGSVEGFFITAIGLDDVTFKKGNVERKLRCMVGHSRAGSQ